MLYVQPLWCCISVCSWAADAAQLGLRLPVLDVLRLQCYIGRCIGRCITPAQLLHPPALRFTIYCEMYSPRKNKKKIYFYFVL
jgi:hypothetical protein